MRLALEGGEPVRSRPMPSRPGLSEAAKLAAKEVIDSGELSGFLAAPGNCFLGGPRVRGLEMAFRERFSVRHAVAMNSATSCLFAAVQALAPSTRNEILVAPWTMSASVTCALGSSAVPVFVDIEDELYGMDRESVGLSITARTKAAVVVDLFGAPPHRMDLLQQRFREDGIAMIEDASQAIGATRRRQWAGTFGDVGIFSLNYHKTIQCGEGGVAVTNSYELAERLRAVRNHGEVINEEAYGWGQNYRMGEVEAAIATAQLTRLDDLTDARVRNAHMISDALEGVEGISTPPRVPDSRHAYYLYALRVPDARTFARALTAEGIPASQYVQPLYRMKAFREYAPEPKRCRKVTAAYEQVVVLPHVHAGMQEEDVADVIAGIQKVACAS